MTLDAALGRLESLLEQEREAIRKVDADGIVRLSEEKESLMQLILQGGLAERADLRQRFERLVDGLGRNGVLLAHARNCVRDVVQLGATASGSYSPKYGPNKATSSGNGLSGRISVTG
jgi:hypothetical protein